MQTRNAADTNRIFTKPYWYVSMKLAPSVPTALGQMPRELTRSDRLLIFLKEACV